MYDFVTAEVGQTLLSVITTSLGVTVQSNLDTEFSKQVHGTRLSEKLDILALNATGLFLHWKPFALVFHLYYEDSILYM